MSQTPSRRTPSAGPSAKMTSAAPRKVSPHGTAPGRSKASPRLQKPGSADLKKAPKPAARGRISPQESRVEAAKARSRTPTMRARPRSQGPSSATPRGAAGNGGTLHSTSSFRKATSPRGFHRRSTSPSADAERDPSDAEAGLPSQRSTPGEEITQAQPLRKTVPHEPKPCGHKAAGWRAQGAKAQRQIMCTVCGHKWRDPAAPTHPVPPPKRRPHTAGRTKHEHKGGPVSLETLLSSDDEAKPPTAGRSAGCAFLRQPQLPPSVEELAEEFAEEFPSYASVRQHLQKLTERSAMGMRVELRALDEFDAELEDLDELWATATDPLNAEKNRYLDILANEHTRFKLLPCGQDGQDYINCNLVDGAIFGVPQRYLCGQAPLPGTMAHWWQMVWQAEVAVIVMLTKETEKGFAKAHRYWPEEPGCSVKYGAYDVTLVDEEEVEGCSDVLVRTLKVTAPNSQSRLVTHVHYVGWPDYGVPEDQGGFLKTLDLVDNRLAAAPAAPILVHCSAGVGRTGVFLTVHITASQMRRHRRRPKRGRPFAFNILRTVCQLRWCRSHAVQTMEQYLFCYDVINHLSEATTATGATR